MGVHFQRSLKSAAEVTIALSLVWRFQKSISCRGKYALYWQSPTEVTFRGHEISCRGHHEQLQRSTKSAAEVTIALSLALVLVEVNSKYALFSQPPIDSQIIGSGWVTVLKPFHKSLVTILVQKNIEYQMINDIVYLPFFDFGLPKNVSKLRNGRKLKKVYIMNIFLHSTSTGDNFSAEKH